jgi:dihydrolipoamide dehydrogenase
MMLAHYASYQGEIAALNAADPAAMQKADNTVIPACVFSDPEIACVGLNDEVAKGAGRKISVRKFDFLSSGMARVIGETEGFIKVTCEADSGRILGASIIGPRATELISVLGLAISNNLTADQVSKTVFAHPSLAESFGEIF